MSEREAQKTASDQNKVLTSLSTQLGNLHKSPTFGPLALDSPLAFFLEAPAHKRNLSKREMAEQQAFKTDNNFTRTNADIATCQVSVHGRVLEVKALKFC